LKVHRVDLLCGVSGLWDCLVDRGNLTFYEADNLSRYVGSSAVLGHRVELFHNSAWYRGHCEAVPFSGLNLMGRDFVKSVDLLCGVKPKRVFLDSFEAVVDFPASRQLLNLNVGYLKVYFKQKLGKWFVRSEIFMKDLGLEFPFDKIDERKVSRLMLKSLEVFDETRNFLNEKLGVPKERFGLQPQYTYDGSLTH